VLGVVGGICEDEIVNLMRFFIVGFKAKLYFFLEMAARGDGGLTPGWELSK
jgi:hypothetical protein